MNIHPTAYKILNLATYLYLGIIVGLFLTGFFENRQPMAYGAIWIFVMLIFLVRKIHPNSAKEDDVIVGRMLYNYDDPEKEIFSLELDAHPSSFSSMEYVRLKIDKA